MTFAAGDPWEKRLPDAIDPAVAFVLRRTGGVKATRMLEADADLGHDTVRMWLYYSHKLGPRIKLVRRALRAMGYDLAVVPLESADA